MYTFNPVMFQATLNDTQEKKESVDSRTTIDPEVARG